MLSNNHLWLGPSPRAGAWCRRDARAARDAPELGSSPPGSSTSYGLGRATPARRGVRTHIRIHRGRGQGVSWAAGAREQASSGDRWLSAPRPVPWMPDERRRPLRVRQRLRRVLRAPEAQSRQLGDLSLDFQDGLRRRELLLEPGHFGLELTNALLQRVAPGAIAAPPIGRHAEDGAVVACPAPCPTSASSPSTTAPRSSSSATTPIGSNADRTARGPRQTQPRCHIADLNLKAPRGLDHTLVLRRVSGQRSDRHWAERGD